MKSPNSYSKYSCLLYLMIKDSKYVKINNVNPLYLIFSNANGYFEEINISQYLTLVPANESKEKNKKNMKDHGLKLDI